MTKANIKDVQNKNRNTWAKLSESSNPIGTSKFKDGEVGSEKKEEAIVRSGGVSGDIRDASILQAARSSFVEGMKQAKIKFGAVINEDILEQYVMSEKMSKKIGISFNFLRFCKIFFYHLLFPFSSERKVMPNVPTIEDRIDEKDDTINLDERNLHIPRLFRATKRKTWDDLKACYYLASEVS